MPTTIHLHAMIITITATSLACSHRKASEAATTSSVASACIIAGATEPRHDILFRLLTETPDCPRDVFDFRQKLSADGLQLTSTFVANRGFHNPALGSFSLFEMAHGQSLAAGRSVGNDELFFGHFTGKDDSGQITLDQNPASGSLMIELIAWDAVSGAYSFYELRGQGAQGAWFYRGDSLDIVEDVKQLHRQTDPSRPQFGRHLRCSGCHTNGGPIMKELAAPHNDWWRTDRPTPLTPGQPDAALSRIMSQLADAETLAQAVHSGNAKLSQSTKYRQALASRNLQERLRPLFCPVEINLESDGTASDTATAINVPSAFFADPRLATAVMPLDRLAYSTALTGRRARFPETALQDGDHAWLAPVKAASDQTLIDAAVADALIDKEFVADVLAVDFTNPTLSPTRCSLLPLVPVQASAQWQAHFVETLQQANSAAARELVQNLTDPSRNQARHRAHAADFLAACQQRLAETSNAAAFVALLGQRRAEVFTSEISKNPMGQIFEPGFRVIFPTLSPPARPNERKLNEQCVIE